MFICYEVWIYKVQPMRCSFSQFI